MERTSVIEDSALFRVVDLNELVLLGPWESRDP